MASEYSDRDVYYNGVKLTNGVPQPAEPVKDMAHYVEQNAQLREELARWTMAAQVCRLDSHGNYAEPLKLVQAFQHIRTEIERYKDATSVSRDNAAASARLCNTKDEEIKELKTSINSLKAVISKAANGLARDGHRAEIAKMLRETVK